MFHSSSALDAAIRAMRGESNLDAVRPALRDWRLSQIIALTLDADPIVQNLTALGGGLPALLDESDIADPALHDAVIQIIGTDEGFRILASWTDIVSVGWGRSHAAALIDAVQNQRCNPCDAAALIGPNNESAALLRFARDIWYTIYRWGQSVPDAPTWWTAQISTDHRERLFWDLIPYPRYLGWCLPWFPPDMANQTSINEHVIHAALEAFADASPTARAHHAALLQRIINETRTSHLGALTRLACAMKEEKIWTRVVTLMQDAPAAASSVVSAAPWDDLAEEVRTMILEIADQSDICAAVAASQGFPFAARITHESARAFFKALDPKVWNALDADTQSQWLAMLPSNAGDLAVRFLGPRPAILARAKLYNDLIIAVRRHARNDNAVRSALLPVALHQITPDAAHAMIAAMPTLPPDPGAFFIIASGHTNPSADVPACTTLRTPADLACAVFLQRCTELNLSTRTSYTTLRRVLRGRPWMDMTPIMSLLDTHARAVIMPNIVETACRLAPLRRIDADLALARMMLLPPEIAIPTYVALTQLTSWNGSDMAEVVADMLRDHGDLFLAIADALREDRLCDYVLPLTENAILSVALRALARDNPPTAQRLAQALRSRSQCDALHALLDAPPHHAAFIWRAFDHDLRCIISAENGDLDAKTDHSVLRNPIAAIALAAVGTDDVEVQNAGLNVLTTMIDDVRANWEMLSQKIRERLCMHPMFADLPIAPPRDQRRKRRFGRENR